RALLREPRDPGLPFRLAPGIANECAPENKKPSGAGWLGRVRADGLSISPRRDRSHEPRMRYRLAGGHSTAAQGFPTGSVASCDSCSFTNPIFAKGAACTPDACKCQDEEIV